MKVHMTGGLPDATIQQVMTVIEEMLRSTDKNVTVTLSRGVRYFEDFETNTLRGEPTSGRTLTIEVDGGAAEIHETSSDRMLRLMMLDRI